MKTTTRSIAITLGLSAILGGSALFAEPGEALANVPFEFQVAGKTLPAGKYRVIRDDRSAATTVRSALNGHGVILLTSPLHCISSSESKLVFYPQAEGYKLSEIWFADSGCSYGPLGTKDDRVGRERGMAATVRMLQK